MALKTQSYSISISSKVPYKSCIVSQKVFLWIFFMFSLQAVKRSHRRLGLAQKLMEQVLSSCCFYSCKISSCIILEHYCKLFVWKIFVHRCDIHTLSFKFFNSAYVFLKHLPSFVSPHKFPFVSYCQQSHATEQVLRKLESFIRTVLLTVYLLSFFYCRLLELWLNVSMLSMFLFM